jgi:signal transduction histidine kinase
LQASREELRALAARLETVREEERIRIARELHDELGQALTSLKMDLSWLNRRLSANEEEVPRHLLTEKIGAMSAFVDTTIKSMRNIATQLRPMILDDLGLLAAIEWQALEFNNRTGIGCHYHLPDEDLNLDPGRSTAVFRIFQELLTNVARHANATRVDIKVEVDQNCITLEVKDNGVGIAEDQVFNAKSLGIIGMRERALIFRGDITITSVGGQGTSAILSLPLETPGGR